MKFAFQGGYCFWREVKYLGGCCGVVKELAIGITFQQTGTA